MSFYTSIESPGNTFPCPQNVNINELQFCDGIVDCRNAADEPTDCPLGTITIKVNTIYALCVGGSKTPPVLY